MKEKRKRTISVVALVLIVVLIVTATYAYFAAQTGEGSSTDINVTTATVDNLTFETGDAISINASQSNLATGMNSLSDDTYAMATLAANNDTNSASSNYYVYLNISTNEFEYTTSDSTAELILSITMDGTEVTSLDGYDYVSVTDGNSNVISGFDITTASGLITIADNYLIESAGIEVDDWEITVTFVNLDSDQSGNAGKSLSASLIIQQEEILTFANYLISLYTEDGENAMYYFDGEGDYTNSDLEAVDYSYRYSGSSDVVNNYVYFGSSGYCYYDGNEVYNFENWSTDGVTESSCSTVYKVTDDDYTGYFDDSYTSYITEYGSAVWDSEDNVCKTSDGNEVYTWYYWNSPTEEQCSGTVYYHSGYGYYVGIEYVGSGEWEEYYSDDNLYRIIGVFKNLSGQYEVKLIKADYATSDLLGTDGDYASDTNSILPDYSTYYLGSQSKFSFYRWSYKNSSESYFNSGYYNDWSYSELNTVNLNTNYLKNIGSKWSNMIVNHTWIVGGNTSANIYSTTVNNIYNNEIVNYVSNQHVSGYSGYVAGSYTAKVGLIYVSDYGYGVDPSYWTSNISSYYNTNLMQDNWLYIGSYEWTITRYTSYNNLSYYISNAGSVTYYFGSDYSQCYVAVRPTFYLNSSVVYTGGSGTIDDPYTLSMN